ncbi:SPOR domain-containing protein [Polycladidibacter stylochi]|uniref:SPOR domain-containing protein n=1 Tax=Polycladidibacter stylochi TaxID=1807766 RepID=UPI000831295C|nr:SPOR domain-containing protein [Pseudovibrio stylochi]
MTNSSDTQRPVQAAHDAKAAELQNSWEQEDDPLAELARLMGETAPQTADQAAFNQGGYAAHDQDNTQQGNVGQPYAAHAQEAAAYDSQTGIGEVVAAAPASAPQAAYDNQSGYVGTGSHEADPFADVNFDPFADPFSEAADARPITSQTALSTEKVVEAQNNQQFADLSQAVSDYRPSRGPAAHIKSAHIASPLHAVPELRGALDEETQTPQVTNHYEIAQADKPMVVGGKPDFVSDLPPVPKPERAIETPSQDAGTPIDGFADELAKDLEESVRQNLAVPEELAQEVKAPAENENTAQSRHYMSRATPTAGQATVSGFSATKMQRPVEPLPQPQPLSNEKAPAQQNFTPDLSGLEDDLSGLHQEQPQSRPVHIEEAAEHDARAMEMPVKQPLQPQQDQLRASAQAEQQSDDLEELLADLTKPAVPPQVKVKAEDAVEVPQQKGSQSHEDGQIDDMAWPQAVNHIETQDDDLFVENQSQPPVGGYDLDAVAQEMEQNDPSLRGGVVPQPAKPSVQANKTARPKGMRKGLMASAAMIAVLIVGATGFALLDLGGEESDVVAVPPVIEPDPSPMKEMAAKQPDEDKNQAQLLLPSQSDAAPEGEQLLPRENAEVDPLPPAPNAVSEPLIVNAPKKVRTVTVRPDGTIVTGSNSGGAAKTMAEKLLEAQRRAQMEQGVTPTPVQQVASNAQEIQQTIAAQTTQPLPVPENNSAQALTTASVGTTQETSPTALPASTWPQRKPVGADAAAVSTSSQNTQGPLDLTSQSGFPEQRVASVQPAAQQQTTQTGAVNSLQGSHVVQISSVRSVELAQGEIRSFNRRFPQLMDQVSPAIVRADLGDKGIYYRVRIPFNSAAQANDFCGQLKNAGGDCFVRRNR